MKTDAEWFHDDSFALDFPDRVEATYRYAAALEWELQKLQWRAADYLAVNTPRNARGHRLVIQGVDAESRLREVIPATA